MKIKFILTGFLLIVISFFGSAEEDRIELETTFIKGNKELPQVLYIVPWQDMKQQKTKQDVIVLHSLFGDTFDPVTPEDLESANSQTSKPVSEK
ncbi:hypothetical protein [Aliikangiella coralliicola]|uniref:Uncharacterized protein n=1 Tax=Aliikangiella coralliicola TaxID=2592383 RepID=A0A545U8Q8_9GAMM|nr:hypothetical protein [Aliikangiella coralliicola]TQV85857.1 hypothetical protein FLL46_18200 [Aliikangiella coralliicola]